VSEEAACAKDKDNGLSGAARDGSHGTSFPLNPQPSTLNPPLIIGLTGPNAAGKGEAAAALKALGFAYHSLSDAVREAAAERGRTAGRDDLILTGNELRREGGPGILAELTLPKLGRRDLVDSIRNPAEVMVLRRVPGFLLLGVTAPPPIRFERARQRQGRGDAVASRHSFVAKEAEEDTSDPTAQRLTATLALADRVVVNDGSLEDLHRKVTDIVAALERGGGLGP
jgi:dephospho-CoA kinase